MKILSQKQNMFHPFLINKKYKFLYVSLNFYIIIGVISLLISIFYLLLNLEQADEVIIYRLRGFAVFLTAAILFAIGYQNMISEQKDKRHRY